MHIPALSSPAHNRRRRPRVQAGFDISNIFNFSPPSCKYLIHRRRRLRVDLGNIHTPTEIPQARHHEICCQLSHHEAKPSTRLHIRRKGSRFILGNTIDSSIIQRSSYANARDTRTRFLCTAFIYIQSSARQSDEYSHSQNRESNLHTRTSIPRP